MLSGDQFARLAECRAAWAAARTSTAPANRAVAEEGVQDAYRAAGLPPPQRIIWCLGPVAMARAWTEALGQDRIGTNVKPILVDAVQSRVVMDIDARVSASVRLALFETRLISRSSLGIAVNEAVLDAANAVRPRWSARLRHGFARLGGRGHLAARLSFGLCSFGQHDVGWLGICEFLSETFGLRGETRSLGGLWKIALNAGWVLPHEHVCWLSERHNALSVDAAGRLHNASGPAIGYPDGWNACFWKGVRVPASLIERPDLITAAAIDRELNRNVRRCMIDMMTPERFIAASGAIPVSVDETGVLWRKQWFRDSWAAVEVVNGTAEADGTRKHYYLQVPPDVRSAREAVAWTYGLTPQQYAGLRLRT
jgi:hypothetical protein